jgi:hypothetical protein
VAGKQARRRVGCLSRARAKYECKAYYSCRLRSVPPSLQCVATYLPRTFAETSPKGARERRVLDIPDLQSDFADSLLA